MAATPSVQRMPTDSVSIDIDENPTPNSRPPLPSLLSQEARVAAAQWSGEPEPASASNERQTSPAAYGRGSLTRRNSLRNSLTNLKNSVLRRNSIDLSKPHFPCAGAKRTLSSGRTRLTERLLSFCAARSG